MSIILADTSPLALARSNGREARLPQTHSWPIWAAVSHTIRTWMARRSQRVALRGLSENKHLLADIGVTRERALSESAKPFWRR